MSQDYCCTACKQPWITHCTFERFAADGTPRFACGKPRLTPDPVVKYLVELFASADEAEAKAAASEARANATETERQAVLGALTVKDAELLRLTEEIDRRSSISQVAKAAADKMLAENASLRDELERLEGRHAKELELRDVMLSASKKVGVALTCENTRLRKDLDDAAGKQLADLAADLGGPIGLEQADALSDLKVTIPDPAAAEEPPQAEPAVSEECHWCNCTPMLWVEYIDRKDGAVYILPMCSQDLHADDLKEYLAENAEHSDQYSQSTQPPQAAANQQEEVHV